MNKETEQATSTTAVPATLQEAAIRELIAAQVVRGFIARGGQGGFVVEVVLGDESQRTVVLGSARSGPRTFANVSTIAMLLRRLGFDQFTVDAAKYEPGRVRAARPDRAEAMRAVKTRKR